jgi:steroid 5-alpha reductase family enzyme
MLWLGLAVAVAVMAAVWALSLHLKNASVVDVAWSLLFTPLVWLYMEIAANTGPRGWLLVGLVTAWSLRLGGHIWMRVAAEHPREDSRYAQLRRDWAGGNAAARFLWFFQFQALAAVLLSVPFAIVAVDPTTEVGWWQLAGALLWAIGLGGEALADRQLARFRADSGNRGRVCQAGLWRYSRHPNYFFEWVIWVAFFVYAAGSPGGGWTVYAPIAMLYILLRVTGVPAAEASSLQSRGERYREYQRTTSVFVPWFRRLA